MYMGNDVTCNIVGEKQKASFHDGGWMGWDGR